MKLCFFTDIHGNKPAFDAFSADIEKKGVDFVVFGGDFIGYYYDAQEIITETRKRQWHCLLGNHDQMFLDMLDGKLAAQSLTARYGNSYRIAKETVSRENIAFLRTLAPAWQMQADGLGIGFFHGTPKDPLHERWYPDADLADACFCEGYDYIFTGHTHHKMMRKAGKCHIVNPGSAGQQRDGKGTSYALLDTAKRHVEICVFSYDTKDLLAQIGRFDGADEAMCRKLTEVLLRSPR